MLSLTLISYLLATASAAPVAQKGLGDVLGGVTTVASGVGGVAGGLGGTVQGLGMHFEGHLRASLPCSPY